MILQPADAQAAFGLAQQAAKPADGLDDFTRAKAALALGISAVWVQPERTPPALSDALTGFGTDHPWECAVTMQCLANTPADWTRRSAGGRERCLLRRRRSHVRDQHAVRHGATVNGRHRR